MRTYITVHTWPKPAVPETLVPAALQKDMDFASKANVLQALEEAAAALNGSAGEDLGDAFKRYRQAVFKLNYKLNKLNNGKKCGKVRLLPDDSALLSFSCSPRNLNARGLRRCFALLITQVRAGHMQQDLTTQQ